jgi:hypothetical protein
MWDWELKLDRIERVRWPKRGPKQHICACIFGFPKKWERQKQKKIAFLFFRTFRENICTRKSFLACYEIHVIKGKSRFICFPWGGKFIFGYILHEIFTCYEIHFLQPSLFVALELSQALMILNLAHGQRTKIQLCSLQRINK